MFSSISDLFRRLGARLRIAAGRSKQYSSADTSHQDTPDERSDTGAESADGGVSRDRNLARRAAEAAGRGLRKK